MNANLPPVLWTPDSNDERAANVTAFNAWLSDRRGVSLDGYDALWRWSVDEIDAFWGAVWEYFELPEVESIAEVLPERRMPGGEWFVGARLNYAGEVLRRMPTETPAIVRVGEDGATEEIPGSRIGSEVAALAQRLRSAGVEPGDRVVAYLPNCPEAVIGLLATAAVGAVWAVCGPDFGVRGAQARFAQLAPKVLIGCERYRFGGREHERGDELRNLGQALPSLALRIVIGEPGPGYESWTTIVSREAELEVLDVPFAHPLWVLFSSGTTGTPKGIVHGHGGIVIEHLKAIVLGNDVHPGERFFFYSSTSWMVWNYLVGGLLAGATVVLYDGSATWPDVTAAWQVAARTRATVFGTGAAYLAACERADVDLASLDLAGLRTVISTGSVLPDRAARWLYRTGREGWRLDCSSGGTDVCSTFVGGSVLKPVRLGRISGSCLGVDVQAWDDTGSPVTGQTGEMVITEPMPSMPLYFWNDPDGSRYRDAYFSRFPGVWQHGDWIRRWEDASFTIEGRSDATLNRSGVRMGAADIYEVVEGLDGVSDSLVIGLELPNGGYFMPLFVVPAPSRSLEDGLEEEIVAALRRDLSPRHVPDEVLQVPRVPRTPTGKKQEVPVKRILNGSAADGAEGDLVWFEHFAEERELGRVRFPEISIDFGK